ncbi:ABC1 family-domain-containing protein [Globomyces pollinis-pini]|nr:ABC1 family-domain-containing protein [Globomyces pollinis-pini]
MSRLLLRSGIVLGSTSGVYLYLKDKEQPFRPLTFWRKIMPIYMHYRYVQWTKQEELNPNVWEDLHLKYAPKVLDAILELKGIYIKVGQVLATRPDIAPKIYQDAFKVLLDGVPGISGKEARENVENQLGRPIDDLFSYFDDKPIAAASVGQVHRAKMIDGRDVVVKIQHPGAFELFQTDIGTVSAFVKMAQPEQALVLDELERQILLEFDFEREAWALEKVHHNITNFFPNVKIPLPVDGLFNRTVLVMDYIPGEKLIDVAVKNGELTAKRLGISFEELQRQSLAPSFTFQLRYLLMKSFSALHRYIIQTYNFTFGRILFPLTVPKKLLDINKLYNDLLQVHGKQLLIDGLLNGDPHPGNILVTPDGKLGLIDYGQVKTFTQKERRDSAKMMMLLNKGPDAMDEIVKFAISMGFETEKNDPLVIYKTCVIAYDRDDLGVTDGLGLQAYMEMMDKRDRTKRIPENMFMAVRTCIILRGLSAILGPNHPPISISHEWQHYAKLALQMFPEDLDHDHIKPIYTPSKKLVLPIN